MGYPAVVNDADRVERLGSPVGDRVETVCRTGAALHLLAGDDPRRTDRR
jgi:hypothetical protein